MTPVPARAAVLEANELGRGDGAGSWHLTANGGCQTGLFLAVLPEGRRAPELGRSLLLPIGNPEGRAAGLGPVQRIEAEVPNWAAELLFWSCKENLSDAQVPSPIDVPVLADLASRAVVDLPTDALAEDLAPWREAGVRLWKENESPLSAVRKVVGAPRYVRRFGSSFVKDWKEGIGDLRSSRPMHVERPDDASHPPIEGVPYEHWIQVRALLDRDKVQPAHVDLYTRYRNIPEQRWQAIDAAWTQRRLGDPRLDAWADYDFRRMRATGAIWEAGY